MKGTIRLCYKKVIDADAQTAWDRFVFEDSFTEFLMQSQMYNGGNKYSSFSDMLQHVNGAERLHFLTGTAVTGYIQQLNGIIPGVTNSAGNLFLPFKDFRFEIMQSDTRNKQKHKVAIYFFSDPLLWIDSVEKQLLVSLTTDAGAEEYLTELFSMQPFLSIYSFKKLVHVSTMQSAYLFE